MAPIEHRDSTGAVGVIGPGAVQWMTAGSGIVHSEMPTGGIPERGGRMHGFQLWVNLRATRQDDRAPLPGLRGRRARRRRHAGRQPVAGDRRRGRRCRRAGRDDVAGRRIAHVTVAAGDAIEWDVPDGHTALVHDVRGQRRRQRHDRRGRTVRRARTRRWRSRRQQRERRRGPAARRANHSASRSRATARS